MGKGPLWSDAENRASIRLYFEALQREQAGEHIDRKSLANELLSHLSERKYNAAELRLMNISGALHEVGLPVLQDVQPGTVIKRLQPFLTEYLNSNGLKWMERISKSDTEPLLDTPPPARGGPADPDERARRARRLDYALIEATRRDTGLRAEKLVLAAERKTLEDAGFPGLARKVEHVAKTQGDGLGYDILSFDLAGREQFVEVKGTLAGPETPFFLSPNELRLAEASPDRYVVHRVHSMATRPQRFVLDGLFLLGLRREPASYRVHVT